MPLTFHPSIKWMLVGESGGNNYSLVTAVAHLWAKVFFPSFFFLSLLSVCVQKRQQCSTNRIFLFYFLWCYFLFCSVVQYRLFLCSAQHTAEPLQSYVWSHETQDERLLTFNPQCDFTSLFRQDLIFSWEKSINRGICVDSQASVTESLRIISSGSLTCEVRTGGTLRLILLPKKSCMRNWLLQITSYHRNYPWKRVWGERGGTGVRAVGFQEISIMYLKKTDQITHQV